MCGKASPFPQALNYSKGATPRDGQSPIEKDNRYGKAEPFRTSGGRAAVANPPGHHSFSGVWPSCRNRGSAFFVVNRRPFRLYLSHAENQEALYEILFGYR